MKIIETINKEIINMTSLFSAGVDVVAVAVSIGAEVREEFGNVIPESFGLVGTAFVNGIAVVNTTSRNG